MRRSKRVHGEDETEDPKEGDKTQKQENETDILEAAGINIEEEEEKMHTQRKTRRESQSGDPRMALDYYFGLWRLEELMTDAGKKAGAKVISHGCFRVMVDGLKIRLCNILAELVWISKHRHDSFRLAFKTKIQNDPCKQMWMLHQLMERSSGEQPPERVQTEERSSQLEKTEALKSRITNQAAQHSLGMKMLPWMKDSQTDEKEQPGNKVATQAVSLSTAPTVTKLTEKELAESLRQRKITMADLVFFFEQDRNLGQSPALTRLLTFSGTKDQQ
ncbi:MAG: transcription initiation factor TFIID component TAF4 family protein [Amphiamblys sp. WSBS2006]|nr:MAG: transcription initiation factor TFIID component TAF4 family protein [Amphiamblys sp. WSBS2006]